jgi:hypothetical protein
MPLAFLLQEIFGALKKGLVKLLPFGQLALIEELLIARARGAFMTHWFGSGLPFHGLSVLIHIDNIAALRKRYQAVLAQVKRDRERDLGPNFTEPLAGLVGVAAGMAASPGGMAAILIASLRKVEWYVGLLIGVIWGPVLLGLAFWMSFLAAAAGAIAFPFATAGAIHLASVNDPFARAIYNFLGALARFAGPLIDFVKQLTGPREEVRNPLLRHVLEVMDTFAGALALVLGFIAVLVTRIAPAVAPLAAQMAPLARLASESFGFLRDIVTDVVDMFLALFVGKKSPFEIFLRTMKLIPKLLVKPLDVLKEMFATIKDRSAGFKAHLKTEAKAWGDAWKEALKKMFSLHPLIMLFKAIMLVKDMTFPAPRTAPTVKKSWWDKFKTALWDAVVAAYKKIRGPSKPTPPFPDFTKPDVDKVIKDIGGEPTFPLWAMEDWSEMSLFMPYPDKPKEGFPVAEWAKKAIAVAAKPPGIFRPAPFGPVIAERDEERELRKHIITVIESVMPSKIREHVPTLLTLFQTIDEAIYATDEERAERKRHPTKEAPPEFPTLELDETKTLKPVIRKVRVLVRGPADEPEVRAFRAKLVDSLQGQLYVVP